MTRTRIPIGVQFAGLAAIIAITLLFAFKDVTPAHGAGATLVVSKETAVSGLVPGSSTPSDGYCSLQEAVDIARQNSLNGNFDCAGTPGDPSAVDTITFEADPLALVFNISSPLDPTGGPLVIQKNTSGGPISISGNDATQILRIASSGDVTLKDVTLTHGKMTQVDCGGAAILNNGKLTLDGVTLLNNSSVAAGNGDSVLCENGGTLDITGSSIYNNFGANGSSTMSFSNSIVTIENTYIAENDSGQGDSGFDANSSSTVSVTNSTIVATDQGALVHSETGAQVSFLNVTLDGIGTTAPLQVNGGTVSAKNTIIARDQGLCPGGGVTNDQGHNLDTSSGCGLNNNNGSLENADPKFGPAASLGGGTVVIPLTSGSQAIDTGTNSGCPGTDQRGAGFPRPIDGNSDGTATCDIGAFEAPEGTNPTASPTPSPSPTHSPKPTHSPTATPSPTTTPTPTPTGPTPTFPPTRKQGDVNCDGNVDEFDFDDLIQYSATIVDGTEPAGCLNLHDPEAISGFPWGDVNCDTFVNALDSLFVLAHTIGIELPQAAGNCFHVGDVMT